MKQQIVYDRSGEPHLRLIIETPEDRIAHIEACEEGDYRSPWGLVENDGYYERVGDHASVNSWYYHDSSIGYERFYANTPDWIEEIANRLGWIAERGEKVLQ